MVPTQIQLTEDQAMMLKKKAKAKHVSIAELIRQSVDQFARMDTFDEEKRKRAIAAAGRFHSGIRDLSVKHNKYLAEAYAK